MAEHNKSDENSAAIEAAIQEVDDIDAAIEEVVNMGIDTSIQALVDSEAAAVRAEDAAASIYADINSPDFQLALDTVQSLEIQRMDVETRRDQAPVYLQDYPGDVSALQMVTEANAELVELRAKFLSARARSHACRMLQY